MPLKPRSRIMEKEDEPLETTQILFKNALSAVLLLLPFCFIGRPSASVLRKGQARVPSSPSLYHSSFCTLLSRSLLFVSSLN